MSYTPKDEATLAKESLFPDGQYDFEVIETSGKPAKSGATMFTLKLRVIAADGGSFYVTDYITLNSNFGERKLRHAADACGLIDIYTSGMLTHEDFHGRAGQVEIKTQEGNAEYPLPKNVVKDYVKLEDGAVASPKPKQTAAESISDEVPF